MPKLGRRIAQIKPGVKKASEVCSQSGAKTESARSSESNSDQYTSDNRPTTGRDQDTMPRGHMLKNQNSKDASGLGQAISNLYAEYKKPVAIVGMSMLRLPLFANPAHGHDVHEHADENLNANASLATEAASTDIASEVIFGAPKDGAKPLTEGAYFDLIHSLSGAGLEGVKDALRDGHLRLLTDIPHPNGERTLVLGHRTDKDANETPNVETTVRLSRDGQLLSADTQDLIHVWAYESDPKSPGGLQPISAKHFEKDSEGKISYLGNDRIRLIMPKEIATEVDDISLTKVTKTVASHLPEKVAANANGVFAFDEASPLTGATTSFYGTVKVMEDADRWAGGHIHWGDKGTLIVKPYEFVTNFFNAYYNKTNGNLVLGALGHVDPETGKIGGFTGTPAGYENAVENMFLDGAKSRDIVAHEAGHAVLDALKPGMKHGMGIAYHEGVADLLNFLSVLEDPDVVARVLRETEGDMDSTNEATRMAEVIGHEVSKHRSGDPDKNYIRITNNEARIEDSGLTRDDETIPGLGFSPSRSPHKLGQVFSGAGHDAFVKIYNQERAAGKSREESVAYAREAVGNILLRSTRYVGEHQTSMRDAAIAMLRSEDATYGGKYHESVRDAFVARGLIDATEDAKELINERKNKLIDFRLPASTKAPDEVLSKLEEYETQRLASLSDDVDGPVFGLLRHNPYLPSYEIAKFEDLSVHSDRTFDDGVRVVRLTYQKEETDMMGHKKTHDYYISTVFDETGKLIDIHSERAVENE
ncbi:MAG: hypothetical protein VYC39_15860 [Myxococcota bacterium]|nr:hypothetical protein [Myxococcota bacterium]